MTNKEKYIDNASSKELADLLANKCIVYKNKIEIPYLDEIEGAVRIENWLSQEVELTADEMFKELGYEKEFSDKNGCNYYHKEINRSGVKSEHIIHVLSNESSTLYGKYERLDNKEFAANISVAEDKAIHKKIEELKK